MILLIAFQLAAAAPHQLVPKDSAKLVARVRDVEFSYIMDWRREWETWRKDVAQELQAAGMFPTPPSMVPDVVQARYTGSCPPPAASHGVVGDLRLDVDVHDVDGRFILGRAAAAPGRNAPPEALFFCLSWISPYNLNYDFVKGALASDGEVLDEALGIDAALPSPYRDTVRARRTRVLQILDSAARQLPGDAWIVGQRVRLEVDQQDMKAAIAVASQCRAAAWWCGVLRGYVHFAAHDTHAAATAFDSALARMPADTACRWNDVSDLLIYSARLAYRAMSCVRQADVNARIWWLADPLYLVPDNDRRTEHFARRVLAALHAASDIDEREDMRDSYMGRAVQEMILRYGWPSTMYWIPPKRCTPGAPPLCYFLVPPGPSRFDTRATYLGPTDAPPDPIPKSAAAALRAPMPGPIIPLQASPQYWGPRYHTLPSWSAITNPLAAKTTDWDLGPERLDSLVWDTSWWPTEFYARPQGALVELSTQIGFIRRHSTAAIVAAMDWPTTTFLPPPPRAAIGVITSGGPAERPHIAGHEMDGAHPRAILTPVESRPLLLGVEMIPDSDAGPAGRTRFGIEPPAPLTALAPGTLGVSDVMLTRVAPGQSYPDSIQDVLPRMYGSTTLVNPMQLAAFWEVYGQGDRDTVDVSIRILRRSDAGLLARAGAAIGIGSSGNDSITVHWREPRSGDPLAFADSGVSIRPRGLVLNVSALTDGAYTLSVQVDRRGVRVNSSPREFTIVRGAK